MLSQMAAAAHGPKALNRIRRVWLGLAGLLLLAALIGWLVTGPILLSSAARQVAGIYTQERPFLLRLPGAGYGPAPKGWSAVPADRLTGALKKIGNARSFPHDEAKAQLLLGRIALLNGNTDEAARQYLRAVRLKPGDSSAALEFAAVLMERASHQRRPVDLATALEYAGNAHRFAPSTSVDSFNLALLYESLPAPHLARDEWERAMRLETVPAWRAEAKAHWDAMNARIEGRAAAIAALRSGPAEYLREYAQHRYLAEATLDEAATVWLARPEYGASAGQALRIIAAQLQAKHGDPWVADLLQLANAPSAPPAYALLADACTRNRRGEYEAALSAAEDARRRFVAFQNRAGELRARLESVIALHRMARRNCLQIAQSLLDDLRGTPYSWLNANAALEETSCHSIAGDSGRLASQRERILESIRSTGYAGLELRALGFLAEPELTRANPARLWRIVHEGLERFWEGDFSAARAQQFYFDAAISGTAGAFPLAAVVMAREGLRVMQEVSNPEWMELCRSQLAAMELTAGLAPAAEETFQPADRACPACPITETRKRYLLEAATSRAEAEVATGNATAAIARLTGLRSEFTEFGETKETPPFEQVLGTAFLRAGRYDEAAASFADVIRRTSETLAAVTDQAQRDGALRAADGAHRGQVFLKLVRDHDPAGALAVWRRFRAQRRGVPVGPVGDTLPDDAALLSIVAAPGGWAVFAADRAAVEGTWVSSETAALDGMARTFTELCSFPGSSVAEIDRVGRAIYRAVIQPVEKRLLAKQVLAINAEGALGAAPWPAISDPQGHRLIDGRSIVMGGGLERTTERRPVTDWGRPLVVDSPALAGDLMQAYPPLGQSLGEAGVIGRKFPGARILTGRAATANAVKEFLPHSSFFHFGGHGAANGGYGAILLAPTASSDGLFDAVQIGQLNLSGVRVVTLASCSSGVGEAAGPVNPESLVRALLDAGVHHVIAAPWDVDSESTSELFGDFYERLAASGGKAEALRQACLRIRRQPPTAHPYYWSGFQIYGEPE
jgi:CHAT domain-containing protein/tetratricopeptide (TPR) repeat protein